MCRALLQVLFDPFLGNLMAVWPGLRPLARLHHGNSINQCHNLQAAGSVEASAAGTRHPDLIEHRESTYISILGYAYAGSVHSGHRLSSASQRDEAKKPGALPHRPHATTVVVTAAAHVPGHEQQQLKL